MTTLAEVVGGPRRVIGGPFGSKLTTRDYTDAGIPVIRGGNMEVDGRWIGGEYAFVSEDKVARDLKTNLAHPGDIIVTQRGTLGQVSIVPDVSRYSRFVISQSQMAISVDKKRVDRNYLYYYLRSPLFADYSNSQTIQTGVPHINLGILRDAPLELRPLSEQRNIADVLGALDDKIELNRRMSAVLEEMARALYRSWFVDFDPVHARALGQPPAHMDPTTAALFPDSFGPDGLPKGWENADIGQELLILDSKRVPLSKQQRQKRQGSVPYYGATSIMDHVDEYIFDDVLLLVGEDGSVVKPDGKPFTQYIWGKSWVNNHAHVLKGKKFSVEQLKCFFETVSIAEFITGAVQLKLNQGNMKKIPWVKAADTVHYAFDELIKPWHTKIRLLEDETANLAALRDTLLPRLMSGDLRIREAEKQVEEVV